MARCCCSICGAEIGDGEEVVNNATGTRHTWPPKGAREGKHWGRDWSAFDHLECFLQRHAG